MYRDLAKGLFWSFLFALIFILMVSLASCNMTQVPYEPEIGTRVPTISIEEIDNHRYLLIKNHIRFPLLVSVVCDNDVGHQDQIIYGIYVEPWGRTSYLWLSDTDCHLNTWRITEDRQ